MAIRAPSLMTLTVVILGSTSLGCAPLWSPLNDATPVPFALTTIEVTAALPKGWMSNTYAPLAGVWMFTRHGEELEEIYLRRWPKAQVVKGTNRSVRNDMTLQDISELSLDSRRLDDGVGGLEVVSRVPATVGGRECYRIEYTYRNAIGLAKRTIEYGCPVGAWMYRFEYDAPVQYYFERHVEPFEAMVKSIQFTTAGA
jgi:hypothetical protein